MSDLVSQMPANDSEQENVSGGAGYLMADTMKAKDIVDIVNDLTGPLNEYKLALKDAYMGVNCEQAKNLTATVCLKLSNGLYATFLRNSKFLGEKNARDGFLNQSSASQTAGEKQVIVSAYDFFCAAEPILQRVNVVLNNTIALDLKKAFQVIRYESAMNGLAKQMSVERILSALQGFDSLYQEFNDASIFHYVSANGSRYSEAENAKMIGEYMTKRIGTSNLSSFFSGYNRVSAYATNILGVIDDYTTDYGGFATYESNLKSDDEAIQNCEQEVKTILSGMAKSDLMGVVDALVDVLEYSERLFFGALTTLDNFRTKKGEAPYSFLSYDGYVSQITNKYMLPSLPDPVSMGTDYVGLFKKLADKYNSLATSIAKNAPRD